MRFSARTDPGRVRSENEDAYLLSREIFAVADGMGGHLAGEIASTTALSVLKREFKKAERAGKDLLVHSIREANRVVYEKASKRPGQRGMGTTLTAMILKDNKFLIGHIGDSRAYLFRRSKLRKLTQDHSLVTEMVKAGEISPQEAEKHPLRSVLTRALGIEPEVEIDLITGKNQAGDKMFLCTDGLNTMLSDSQIREIIAKPLHPKTLCRRLIEAANAQGGQDNITVVLVEFEGD